VEVLLELDVLFWNESSTEIWWTAILSELNVPSLIGIWNDLNVSVLAGRLTVMVNEV
jgi:hypothetical protein